MSGTPEQRCEATAPLICHVRPVLGAKYPLTECYDWVDTHVKTGNCNTSTCHSNILATRNFTDQSFWGWGRGPVTCWTILGQMPGFIYSLVLKNHVLSSELSWQL